MVLMLASCAGKNQKACYEITLTVNGQSESLYLYADENQVDAEVAQIKSRYAMMGIPEDKMSLDIRKTDKSESDCQAPIKPEPQIKRTVKPTAMFSMQVTGVNPEGYSQSGEGVQQICNMFAVNGQIIYKDGKTSTPLMKISSLSTKLQMSYSHGAGTDDVHDNTYVGGRIVCMSNGGYEGENNDHLTEAEKAELAQWMDIYLDGTPDGPFQLKKTCTWTFRLGRDSSYTYVDEIVETYANGQAFKDAILNCDKNNPIFQSLYYYDAEKDEFILQDRKTWNFDVVWYL